MAQMTFTVTTTDDDGYVLKHSGAYPPVSAVTVNTGFSSVGAMRTLNGAEYSIQNGLVRWDTSALPDDINITDVTLRIYVNSTFNANSRQLWADWYTSWPIDATDYTEVALGNALAVSIISLTAGAYNNLPLLALSGFSTNVSTTGYTGLRFHISGGVPTGLNEVWFNDYSLGTSTQASLIVTYFPNSTADSGAGTDTASVTASASVADSGSGVDAVSVSATLSVTDTGVGADFEALGTDFYVTASISTRQVEASTAFRSVTGTVSPRAVTGEVKP